VTPHYRNTPLQEAVFEFAPRGPSFDGDGFAEMQAELRASYDGEGGPTPSSGALMWNFVNRTVMPSPARTPDRFRAWTADRARTALVGHDLCAFNAMAPYTHFLDYLPAMESLFRAYAKHANAPSVAFLGQRYINRISLPTDADPSDYFTVYPKVPADWPRTSLHRPFSMQILTEELETGHVVVTLAMQQQNPPIYFLDIYARTNNDPEIAFEWEPARDWQARAHEAVKRAFEFTITDRCRTILGREDR